MIDSSIYKFLINCFAICKFQSKNEDKKSTNVESRIGRKNIKETSNSKIEDFFQNGKEFSSKKRGRESIANVPSSNGNNSKRKGKNGKKSFWQRCVHRGFLYFVRHVMRKSSTTGQHA